MSFAAVSAVFLSAFAASSAGGGFSAGATEVSSPRAHSSGSAVPFIAQDSLPSLSGTVRAGGYGPEVLSDGPLDGAVVEVRQDNQIRRFNVGADGGYGFAGLVSGPAELIVFHLGTYPFEMEVQLPARGRVELDLVLRRRVIPVAGVQIRALPTLDSPVEPIDRSDPSLLAIGLRSLEASSGLAESGLASALGSDEPGEPGGVLYTFGSTVDSRLVLLDGAPVLTPFHVAGLVEPFDSRLLGSAELYLGAAPSSYSDGVSYLLDVETRPARRDRPRFAFGADGLTVDALAELPLPMSGSLLAGGRFLHGVQESLGGAGAFPYRYDDVLIRADFFPSPGHALRITAFENHEGVRLDLGGGASPLEGQAIWGNRALSAGYEGRIGPIQIETTGAASRYQSKLPISGEDPVLAGGVGDRLRLTGSAAIPFGPGSLRMGGSIEELSFSYDLDVLPQTASTVALEPGLALTTSEAGLFAEWDGALNSIFGVRAGIRADRYSHDARIRVSPRIALRLAVGERAELFTAAGRYHQVLPAPGLRSTASVDGAPSGLGWNPTLPVASASHLVVGLEQGLDQDVRVSLAGFVKAFSGLGERGDHRSRSSGTELRVSRGGHSVRGWFGYALSWFWVDEGPSGSTRFDGRHLLSLGIEGTVPGGVEIKGTLGFGAGLPMTAVGLPSQGSQVGSAAEDLHAPTTERVMNSGGGAPLELAPVGDFLRMDLEIAWQVAPRIGGRRTELQPYIKILNALNRRDALFYYFDRWKEEEARPLSARAVLPLVGLRWQF